KVERYSIKSGPYKDIGSDARPMTEAERDLLQSLIANVLNQFKKAIETARNLTPEVVDRLADGRIFTGEQAQKLGLVDQLGGLEDAILAAGQAAGIEGTPEVFRPRPPRPRLIQMLLEPPDEDDMFEKLTS